MTYQETFILEDIGQEGLLNIFSGGFNMKKNKKIRVLTRKDKKAISLIVAILFISSVFASWIIFSHKEVEAASPGIDLNAYPVPPGGETRLTLSPTQFVGKVATAYRAAREIPEVLDKVYCYCDCELNFGHKSNLSCFVDEHAANCGICLDEALDAFRMVQKDLSVEEIKERIDAKYGKRLKQYSKSERVRLISFMQDI